MRLLELRANGSASSILEFHPSVTVVNGLSEGARASVLRALEALPAGDDPGLGGLVEAHGVLFDLTQETLELFGLDSPVDVVVRAADLPGSPPEAPVAPAPEPAAPAGPTAEEIAVLRQEVQEAAEAYKVLDDAHERAKHQVAAASDVRQRVMTALDGARRARDQARARTEASGTAASEELEVELRSDYAQLETALAELRAAIEVLEEHDPRPVEVLLEAYKKPPSDKLVPSREATALADEFVELQQRLGEIESRLESQGLSTDAALRQLDDARAELAQAQRTVAKPELSAEDEVELEKAHEAVLEAEQKASGRMGRKGALKKLAELQKAEQEILDRVGFPTWTAYVMGSSLLNVDPMAEQRVEAAQAGLEDAELNWATLSEQLENDPDYKELLDRLEAVHLVAFDMLGGDDEGDIEQRLRDLRVPEEEVPKEDIVEALVYQLGLLGVELGDTSMADLVVTSAEDWLQSAEGHWERWQEMKQEEAAVEQRLERVQHEIDTVAAQLETSVESDDEKQAALDAAEAKVSEILSDLEQATELESELTSQLEAREALMGAARLSMDLAQNRLDAALAASEAAAHSSPDPEINSPEVKDTTLYDSLPYADQEAGDEDGSNPGVDELEFYFLTRLAQLRSVSHAGSVPLVIDDALGDLPGADRVHLLEKLDEMAESVQVIYLTDDLEISSWADSAGLDRAAVVRAHGEFA